MTLESAGQFQLNLTERLSSQRPWIPRGFVKQTVGCRAAAGIGDLSEGKARPCCCRWEGAPRAGLASLRSCLVLCLRQSHQEPAFMSSPTTLRAVVRGPKPPQVARGNSRWGVRYKASLLQISPARKHTSHSWKLSVSGQTQTDDAFKWEDTQHVGRRDRARLPPLSLPCSFMKADSGGAVRLRILHTLPPGFGWAQSCLVCRGSVGGTWRKREKLSRSIRVRGGCFTWPRPGQCHALSGIGCQVQKGLTKAEQREQPPSVCFLLRECEELSTTRYFSATSSVQLVYYAFVTARGKSLWGEDASFTPW